MSWPVSGDPEVDAKVCKAGGRGADAASRLFFAGEATHKEDAYTVHGAYMSGTVLERLFACEWTASQPVE